MEGINIDLDMVSRETIIPIPPSFEDETHPSIQHLQHPPFSRCPIDRSCSRLQGCKLVVKSRPFCSGQCGATCVKSSQG